MNVFTWKETLEDEERGGDGLRGVEVEELCVWAGPELPEGVGGGGEGRPHSAQVPQWFSFSSGNNYKASGKLYTCQSLLSFAIRAGWKLG